MEEEVQKEHMDNSTREKCSGFGIALEWRWSLFGAARCPTENIGSVTMEMAGEKTDN
jgi:hypothetical protein